MPKRSLSLNQRLTLMIGLGSVLSGIVSTVVAYLALRQSETTTELVNAVKQLQKIAEQSQVQTHLLEKDVGYLEDGLKESRTQSDIFSRQASSLAAQAEQEKNSALANAELARTSANALSVQRRYLFLTTSPHLAMTVQHIDGVIIKGNDINVEMTLYVTLKGQYAVKNYAVTGNLVPYRYDGHYKSEIDRACTSSDKFGKILGQDLDRDNEVGLQVQGNLAEVTKPPLGIDQAEFEPVYVACASFTSPVDGSVHHVGIIDLIMQVDASGKEVPFKPGDTQLPATNLRRVDFGVFSD